MNSTLEKLKFRKFYKYGSLFWLFLLVVFFLGTWLNDYQFEVKSSFIDGLLITILIFGVFGIPFIFLLSLFIRFTEFIIDKIQKRI